MYFIRKLYKYIVSTHTHTIRVFLYGITFIRICQIVDTYLKSINTYYLMTVYFFVVGNYNVILIKLQRIHLILGAKWRMLTCTNYTQTAMQRLND